MKRLEQLSFDETSIMPMGAAGAINAPAVGERPTRTSTARGNLLRALEAVIEPTMIVLSLVAIAYVVDGRVRPLYVLLGAVAFALTFPGRPRLAKSLTKAAAKIFAGWLVISAMLGTLLLLVDYVERFNATVSLIWLAVAPFAALGGHVALRYAAPILRTWQGGANRVVIVGMNAPGLELARSMLRDPYNEVELAGFTDDRSIERLGEKADDYALLGSIDELSRYVQQYSIHTIYVSLPMAAQPRIQRMLEDLRDTTASIYFVPDMFVTDLIQGGVSMVGGLPVVAVCESPFTGWNGFLKRVSDVAFSLIILAAAAPLMLAIAWAVKQTSPGPAIFKQRRYGQDGHEIMVYKFRSMSVCDDGHHIRQAQPGDERVTPLGAFLRKTSLDELPQFINVIQGRMSIVGPRPHAVAHNEMYRKVIRSYMVRHKVRPGITGWAQVNGLRGETESLEKMEKRVHYDLEYLRKWSLRFDIYIMLKTVWVILHGKNAH
ncbi:MAG TPA: undecaprenyl-phosphate glucose phosphotransferase [Burkholderiales bacterium]|nr:undecaprenyl-phosphate glucose phosphotransferase [Burkholderiales bacterium]